MPYNVFKGPLYAIWCKREGAYLDRRPKMSVFPEVSLAKRWATCLITDQRRPGKWENHPTEKTRWGAPKRIWRTDPSWVPFTHDDFEVHEVSLTKVRNIADD